jgi:hypothetical protein
MSPAANTAATPADSPADTPRRGIEGSAESPGPTENHFLGPLNSRVPPARITAASPTLTRSEPTKPYLAHDVG